MTPDGPLSKNLVCPFFHKKQHKSRRRFFAFVEHVGLLFIGFRGILDTII